MTEKTEALRLAAELDAEIQRTVQLDMMHHNAAAELRRLYLVEQALERCKAVCDATSEGWRADAERWQAQRDALLKACQMLVNLPEDWIAMLRLLRVAVEQARAAIKAVEGEKT